MKKILCIVLALVLVVGLCACGGKTAAEPAAPAAPAAEPASNLDTSTNLGDAPEAIQAEEDTTVEYPEMTLTIADYNTANSGPGQATQMAADYITEASGGKIKCDVYLGGTLMESMDTPSGIADGIADISYYMIGLVSGIQPVGEILTQNFFRQWPQIQGNTACLRRVFEEVPAFQEELAKQGLYAVTELTSPGSFMVFTDDTAKDINTPDDLKGKIVMASSAYLVKNYNDNYGVSGMGMGPADWYSNFERGVCDALVINLPAFKDFGIDELIKSYVTFGDNGSLSAGGALYIANLERWNSFDPNVQALIKEAFVKAADWCVARDFESENAMKEIEWAEDSGKVVHSIPESEMGPWYELAGKTVELWKAAVKEQGIDADAIFEQYSAVIDDYMKDYSFN